MSRVFSPKAQKRRSQAKQSKKNRIMGVALELFSRKGVNATSIDQIAELADVSKTNLLYYFSNKDQLYLEVIKSLLEVWLTPLKMFSADQDPIKSLSEYLKLKLEMSRDNPQESRLFCMEIVQGAPLLLAELKSPLHDLVETKVSVINEWINAGKMAKIDPYHLIFSIWSTTQHYADFAVQIEAITGKTLKDPVFFNETLETLNTLIIGGISLD